jgi:hypothetical protein
MSIISDVDGLGLFERLERCSADLDAVAQVVVN